MKTFTRAVLPPTLLCDFYKVSHREQYPEGTEVVYSTWTPRGTRLKGVNEVVMFGLQGFIKEWLMGYFDEMFFKRRKDDVIEEYKRVIKYTLGVEDPDTSHLEELHDYGRLPIIIRSVKEGTVVPLRTPMFTIENICFNGRYKFFWITNYLETLISNYIWLPMTSATIAFQYRKLLEKYAAETVGNIDGVKFQAHDFSMRGLGAPAASITSGAAHLLSFVGTDTIPAINYHEAYYNADIEKELVGTSIPATEHSVMCAGGNEDERAVVKRLLTEVYPSGFFSMVSDTWDFWNMIENIIPSLKDEIMSRDGRLVIRPDSGDPVEIICGIDIQDFNQYKYEYLKSIEDAKELMKYMLREKVYNETAHGEQGEHEVEGFFKFKKKYYKLSVYIEWNRYDKQYYYIEDVVISKLEEIKPTAEQLGLIESLWNTFGGTVTENGYKLLDSHIGAIYGDSITYERAEQIVKRLKEKGFASTNIVFGVGSFTYQYNTRDTFGFAMKATHAIINGEEKFLFKDPKTDSGLKKSQRGRVVVYDLITQEGKKIFWKDGLTISDQESYDKMDMLEYVFIDGELVRDESLSEIRERLYSQI